MSKRKIIVRSASFLLVFLMLFSCVNEVLKRKTINGPWNFSVKTGGFYNLEKNTLDYMAFGSSHCYCSINPLVIWRETGIKGYLLTSQQQPVKATYYYIKEALKTQNPKVIILESYMLGIDMSKPDEGVIRDAYEYFRPSKNKIDLINALVPEGDSLEYYINFFKYHSRWKDITIEDFNQEYKKQIDDYRGYVFLEEMTEQEKVDISKTKEINDISGENLEYLLKIKKLLDENNIKLILYHAPFVADEDMIKNVNGVQAFSQKEGVPFINGFEYYNELNFAEDFYDSGHVNYRGAEKLSEKLAIYLQDYIEVDRQEEIFWSDSLKKYEENIIS